MGNNLIEKRKENFFDHWSFSSLKNLQNFQGRPHLVRHHRSGVLGEKFTIILPSNSNPAKEFHLYDERQSSNSGHLVSVLAVYPKRHSFNELDVVTEHIPFRFSQIKELSSQEATYILYGILEGISELLYYTQAPFTINSSMIGVNRFGVIKVWAHPVFALNTAYKEPEHQTTQATMIEKIIKIIQQKLITSKWSPCVLAQMKNGWRVDINTKKMLIAKYLTFSQIKAIRLGLINKLVHQQMRSNMRAFENQEINDHDLSRSAVLSKPRVFNSFANVRDSRLKTEFVIDLKSSRLSNSTNFQDPNFQLRVPFAQKAQNFMKSQYQFAPSANCTQFQQKNVSTFYDLQNRWNRRFTDNSTQGFYQNRTPNLHQQTHPLAYSSITEGQSIKNPTFFANYQTLANTNRNQNENSSVLYKSQIKSSGIFSANENCPLTHNLTHSKKSKSELADFLRQSTIQSEFQCVNLRRSQATRNYMRCNSANDNSSPFKYETSKRKQEPTFAPLRTGRSIKLRVSSSSQNQSKLKENYHINDIVYG